MRTVALWPDPAVPDLTDVAALCLPALGLQALATAALTAALRDRPARSCSRSLDAVGLLERPARTRSGSGSRWPRSPTRPAGSVP